MNLQIVNSSAFVNGFIGNLSKIADTGILKIDGNKISCTTATGDNTIIVNSCYTFSKIESSDSIILNVPDLKKLHRLLSLLEGDSFTLKADVNSIGYTSDDVKFVMHLYDDGILSSPSVNVDKINSIPFTNNFDIKIDDIKSLSKSSFLLPDVQKMYFTFRDGRVYGEITDKTQHNVDSFTKLISNKVEGDELNKSLPVNIEVLRLLTGIKNDMVSVKYSSEYGVLTFAVTDDNLFTRYIVSGLVN